MKSAAVLHGAYKFFPFIIPRTRRRAFWNYTSDRSFLKRTANGFKINGCGWEPWRARAPNLFRLLDHETRIVSYVFRSNIFTNEQLKPRATIGPRLCRCVAAHTRVRWRAKREEFRDNALHKFVPRSDWVNLTESGNKKKNNYDGRDKLSMASDSGRYVDKSRLIDRSVILLR